MTPLGMDRVGDYSRGLTAVEPADPDAFTTALTLYIGSTRRGENSGVSDGRLHVYLSPHPDYAKFMPPILEAPLTLSPAEISGSVALCIRAWATELLDFRVGGHYPFEKYASHPLRLVTSAEESLLLERKLRKLAEAGFKLFQALFLPAAVGYEPKKQAEIENLRQIGFTLRTLAEQSGLRIRIVSDSVYAPWNLLYLWPDFRNPGVYGFWGLQHSVEHEKPEVAISPEPLEPGLSVALHFDEDIDTDFPEYAIVRGVQSLLERYDIRFRKAHTRDAFLDDLASGAAGEEIFYFCCHASAEGDLKLSFESPRLQLKDMRSKEEKEAKYPEREYIEPGDIRANLAEQRWLKGRPIVFMNACEASKMNSIFYPGFAGEFLGHSASAVLGPHVQIPIVFARAFAERFFEELFQGGRENNVGAVLLRLRRQFLIEEKNPLGLAYCLYRGADVYIRSAVLKASPR